MKKLSEKEFWTRVNKDGPIPEHCREFGKCWVWTGSIFGGGYGHFGRGYAHRFSWELVYGKIPNDLLVLHACDNKPCVNPLHLFLGTQLDNMHDMYVKGRSKRSIWPKDFDGTHMRRLGATNGSAILTNELVEKIFYKRLELGMSVKDIMEDLHIGEHTVRNVLGRRSWIQRKEHTGSGHVS